MTINTAKGHFFCNYATRASSLFNSLCFSVTRQFIFGVSTTEIEIKFYLKSYSWSTSAHWRHLFIFSFLKQIARRVNDGKSATTEGFVKQIQNPR